MTRQLYLQSIRYDQPRKFHLVNIRRHTCMPPHIQNQKKKYGHSRATHPSRRNSEKISTKQVVVLEIKDKIRKAMFGKTKLAYKLVHVWMERKLTIS